MKGFSKFIVQNSLHGMLGGTMSVANGGKFGQGFVFGFAGSVVAGGVGKVLE